MSRIVLHEVRKRFGVNRDATKAINGLDLTIEPGEFFVLLGPSGCGKTTTLRCIAGLERPDSGRIEIAGSTVADPTRKVFIPPHKRDLGMVFQSYALWPHMSVLDNVAYPVKARRSRHGASAVAMDALRLVGLDEQAKRYPAALSGGQQQRVALARALAASPELLLFDEPLSNLDATLRLHLRQQLRDLHQQLGFTAVYVTHDQAEALALADRVAIMREGRLEQVGSPQQLYNHPASAFVASFVGFENILQAIRVSDSAPVGDYDLGLGAPLRLANDLASHTRHASVALRAEHMRLAPMPSAQALSVSVDHLTGVQFQGGHHVAVAHIGAVKVHIQIAPQHIAQVTQRVSDGAGLYLHIDLNKAVLLPPTTPPVGACRPSVIRPAPALIAPACSA